MSDSAVPSGIPDFWFEPCPWVNGTWKRTETSLPVRDPATARELARVGSVDSAMVEEAVAGAVAVQREWAAVAPPERGRILRRVGDLLLERSQQLAALLSAEQGKPFEQARAEVEYAASFFHWYAEEIRRASARVVPHPEPGRHWLVERVPCGVAGVFTPWNFPLAQGAKKLSAALAAGCSVVWKPSEYTPLVALGLAPILSEAGVPPGGVQIVTGEGPLIGGILAAHPRVRVLSLTGACATGSALLAAAAPGIKRVALELGGNAPVLVLEHADVAFVADQIVRMKLFVTGQVCVTANRVFVPQKLLGPLREALVENVRAARVGSAFEPGVAAGPLIHARACRRVEALVAAALQSGARILHENRSFQRDPEWRSGSYFPPMVVDGVEDAMPLAAEEVFGPVISLLTYRTVPEAVARANATEYGLAGFVYGEDLAECAAVAGCLEVGIVGVNEWRPLKAEIPFGGVKRSGFGAEGGEEGLREFLDTRVVSLPAAR
jgi:succinate-semialdehyde dehydrogenase/glutarate-semialdehyde dehydrogenase